MKEKLTRALPLSGWEQQRREQGTDRCTHDSKSCSARPVLARVGDCQGRTEPGAMAASTYLRSITSSVPDSLDATCNIMLIEACLTHTSGSNKRRSCWRAARSIWCPQTETSLLRDDETVSSCHALSFAQWEQIRDLLRAIPIVPR